MSQIDFGAKSAVKLLNKFPGVLTFESCSGHIQNESSYVTRYVDGFEFVNARYWFDKKSGALEGTPSGYQMKGQMVDLNDMKAGFFGHNDDVYISPLEHVYTDELRNLSFTGSYLLFSKFSTHDYKSAEIERRLVKLYQRLPIVRVRENNSFFILGKDFINPQKEEIGELIRIQQATDELWKQIENECLAVL